MRTGSRRRLATAAAATLALAAAASPALGGPSGDASRTKSVSVRDNAFSPRSTSISRGDRVRWSWRGDNPHNVRFSKVPGGASKKGSSTQTSGRFSRSFTKKGTYSYVCTIHAPSMRGSVAVR